MEAEIKRIVKKQFPELASAYHLPIFARVESISDPQAEEAICDPFRNRYAVDLRVLTAQGEIDTSLPLFRDVPLPVPFAGLERGSFAYPDPGTIVEIAFGYGLPDQIFIRTILARHLSMPACEVGDHINQQAPGVFDKTKSSGDKLRTTHGTITDTCTGYTQDSLSSTTETVDHQLNAKANSSETITGTKSVEALGALKLLSGGHCNLSAVNNLSLTTASDNNITVGNDLNVRVGNISDSIANLKQLITVKDGGTVWLGDESNNALDLLSQLMGIVGDLAGTLATHKHTGVTPGTGTTAVPAEAADFTQSQSDTNSLKSLLDPIVE